MTDSQDAAAPRAQNNGAPLASIGVVLAVAGFALLVFEVVRTLTGSVLGSVGTILLWVGVGGLAVGLLLLVLSLVGDDDGQEVVADEAAPLTPMTAEVEAPPAVETAPVAETPPVVETPPLPAPAPPPPPPPPPPAPVEAISPVVEAGPTASPAPEPPPAQAEEPPAEQPPAGQPTEQPPSPSAD